MISEDDKEEESNGEMVRWRDETKEKDTRIGMVYLSQW